MPKYDYLCETNGQVVEVNHPMKDRLATWGELCALTGQDLAGTPADAPVTKLLSAPGVVRASSLKTPSAPPCQTGAPCCGANRCDFA